MQIKPERRKYLQLRESVKRAPVWGEEYFPQLSPALLYQLLFATAENSFLFESSNGPPATTRYSLMGESNSRLIHAEVFEDGKSNGLEQINFDCWITDAPAHFWGGWVGYIGYDAACLFEQYSRRKKDGLNIPAACFMQVERLAVYDHESGLLKYMLSPETKASDYDHLANEIQQAIENNTSASVIIWLGSCFGACDVPLQVERLGVDLLIQWGHSTWRGSWY